MATVAQWMEGARPRTLPNAIAPVLVGAGAAAAIDHFIWWQAVLALVVSLALIIGVNFANDYSDGIRGTDEHRVGPLRLVGSGTVPARLVRVVAFACFGLAGVAGAVLVVTSGHWWLLLVGIGCVLGAWFYTGGNHPYGYLGLGEAAVFLFFGPVAVLGTSYVQSGPPNALTMTAAVGVGMLSCSVLVVNNLRDIDTDARVGKRTLAVLLGDPNTRRLYAALVILPFTPDLAGAIRSPWMLLGLLAAPLAASPVRQVLSGLTGRELIALIGTSGKVMLIWSVGTAVGLALST
jgi:1,4-dihydroxy-2-naphthoate octaprenyltransferase